MSFDFDLDIHHYSISDIEKLFSLNTQKTYTANDVEKKEYALREQVLHSSSINKRVKRDIAEFFEEIKNLLIFAKCKNDRPLATSRTTTGFQDQYDLPRSTPPDNTIPSRERDLIQHPNKEFVYSQNSDYFGGKSNPLNTRIVQKCITIDSKFRDNFYGTQASDFILQLPNKINKVVSMAISSLEFPITFYNISASYGNNYFYLGINYLDTTVMPHVNQHISHVFIVPDGNYTATDLIINLNTQFSVHPNLAIQAIQITIGLSDSGSGTGKITVSTTTTNPNITAITMDYTRNISGIPEINPILTTKIGWNLGFFQPVYQNAMSYTAETVIDPSSLRYFYLSIDDYHNNVNTTFVSTSTKQVLNPNTIARIALKGSPFTVFMENDFILYTETRKYFGPVDIHRLHIQLYDDHGRLLSVNSANYSFSLIFDVLYDL
jgi:hypothetical protein